MKRLLLTVLVLGSLSLSGQSLAASFPCDLPETKPLRVEYAGNAVGFRMSVFGKPGIVVAAHDAAGAELLRQLGAKPVYWYMKLQRAVGTPSAPADPASVPAAAETLFQSAVRISACPTPVIALNELWGWSRPTPWSYETQLYRQNVLALVKALAAKGALPVLLVPGPWYGNKAPFVDGDASAWWREVARYAHIVRQMHFNARYIRRLGPIVGARTRRIAMRNAVAPFLSLGIPAERMGLLLGFQSGPGKGGREGLEPREAWLEIVKQDALSARQVAAELGLGSIWSWGWATFDEAGADPDKPAAACVYLWANDPTLCDGPRVAGPRFNASLTLGQIVLPDGVQCRTGLGAIRVASVERFEALLGSRAEVLGLLLTRLVHRKERVGATAAEIDRAEQDIVARSFGGDGSTYRAYLETAGLSRALVREILADQLRAETFDAVVQIRHGVSSAGSFERLRIERALATAICLKDELPPAQAFDWAGPFPALQVTPSSVSITSGGVVARGRPLVLRGRVSGIRADRTVTIYARRPASDRYVAVRRATVGADGSWRATVSPTVGTYYRSLARGAVSPAVYVRVRGPR